MPYKKFINGNYTSFYKIICIIKVWTLPYQPSSYQYLSAEFVSCRPKTPDNELTVKIWYTLILWNHFIPQCYHYILKQLNYKTQLKLQLSTCMYRALSMIWPASWYSRKNLKVALILWFVSSNSCTKDWMINSSRVWKYSEWRNLNVQITVTADSLLRN